MKSFETQLMASWPPANWQDVGVVAAVSGGTDSVALRVPWPPSRRTAPVGWPWLTTTIVYAATPRTPTNGSSRPWPVN